MLCKCGIYSCPEGKTRCFKCEREFINRRVRLMNEAKIKFGGLTQETLPKIQAYIRNKERKGEDDGRNETHE